MCNYIPEKNALSLISRTDATQKRASMIQNMHFRNISQKAMLLKRTEEAVKQLESTKLHSTGGCVEEELEYQVTVVNRSDRLLTFVFFHSRSFFSYTEEFSVRDDLMGLAIGAQGSNIQAARDVPGIVQVELDETTGTFKILGEVSNKISGGELRLIS